MKEATELHTRILRCMLAVEDTSDYWRKLDRTVPLDTRATVAFRERWFGTKSEARVRTLVTDLAARFDAYPEALDLLVSLMAEGRLASALRVTVCHLHVQLADPLYRRFTGELLPRRRAQGYTTIDRPIVSRWLDEVAPDRWAAVTATKFASNLLATAFDAGLVSKARDPRALEAIRPSPLAIGYALYLLRPIQIEGTLTDNPYLRSLGVTPASLVQDVARVPGISAARAGDLVDVQFHEPSLGAWGRRYLTRAEAA